MITQPGFGIYQKENNSPLKSEINHEPIEGTPHTGFGWCAGCLQHHFYNWLELNQKDDRCQICSERRVEIAINEERRVAKIIENRYKSKR